MDPDATLAVMVDPGTDRHERMDALRNLITWIDEGGYEPTLPEGHYVRETSGPMRWWHWTIRDEQNNAHSHDVPTRIEAWKGYLHYRSIRG